MNGCCFGCTDRAMGCHGRCDRYATEKAKHEAVMSARRSFLNAEDDATEYFVEQIRKRRH